MEHHAPSQALVPIYLKAAGRGLSDVAKDLLFVAIARDRDKLSQAPWV